jgi:5-deoxy-glucuronate isomerase
MLADMLFRVPRSNGLALIERRGERDAKELTTWRLCLDAGSRAEFRAPGEETGGCRFDASRADVFSERATALYLPPGRPLSVLAHAKLEAVLVSTPAPDGGDPARVGPEDIQSLERGRGLYTREVRNIFVTDPHVTRLMVGETINPPGMWSSFPPHKHDGRDGEPVLEEIYYYRVDPPQGFGHQMMYTTDGESVTHAVRDGDAVLLPYGYHPVSAPPGYRVYYLWAMAGAQRKLALYEDPAHKWIHDAQP